MSKPVVRFNQIADAEVMACLPGRVSHIEERLLKQYAGIWGTTHIANRLRRLERQGLVRRVDRYTFPNSIYWEAAV